MKTRVGDLVGGVGLVNDGGDVRFVIETGTLRVGPDGTSSLSDVATPFVVSGGRVYIDSAMIRNLDASVITTGVLSADRIGTRRLTAAEISAIRIDASQITTGTSRR